MAKPEKKPRKQQAAGKFVQFKTVNEALASNSRNRIEMFSKRLEEALEDPAPTRDYFCN